MFGREVGEEGGHGKPVSVQWDKVNDQHLLRSSSLLDSDAIFPEPDALDLSRPPIYAFALNMFENGETIPAVIQMFASFGVEREAARNMVNDAWTEVPLDGPEINAKRSLAAGWYTDAENGLEDVTASSFVNEQLFDENAKYRDLSDHDRESHHVTDGKHYHHKHRTNDAREHAPDKARGYGLGMILCGQCMGSGCGHCAGTGQVTPDQASTPTQPLTDATPSVTPDAGTAFASLKTADYSVNDPLSGGGGQGYAVPPQHSNSANPASTGWATSQDPGDWGRSLISNDFGVTFDASLHTAKSSSPLEGPTVSGVALKAADTGRVLMIQRSNKDESDPAKGTWEFPGGHHEEGDQTSLHAGIREWQEETGQPFPEGGHVTHVHRTGPYNLHTVVIPEESGVKFHEGRSLDNPDDPDGDDHENAAWWEPEHAKKNPALRAELKGAPSWGDIKKAAVGEPQFGVHPQEDGPYENRIHNGHYRKAWQRGYQHSQEGRDPEIDSAGDGSDPKLLGYAEGYLSHAESHGRTSSLETDDLDGLVAQWKEHKSNKPADMRSHEGYQHTKRQVELEGKIKKLRAAQSSKTDDLSLDSVMSVYTDHAEATLHDGPEPALPSTDGADEDGSSILAGNSVDGPHDTDDAQHVIAQFLASKGAAAIIDGDRELAAKVAMKDFSHAEQQELINEGQGDRARNFSDLKIAGTHYEKLPEDDSDNLWFL
jgi:8-oxo-dGTP pyrophosphatase MutT (NUDIX family)